MNKLVLSVLFLLEILRFGLCQSLKEEYKDKQIKLASLLAYNKWSLKNKKQYTNADETIYRQLIFFENLIKVEQHNSNSSNTFQVGLNQFSDMTQEEFSQIVLSQVTYIPENEEQVQKPKAQLKADANPVVYPDTLDWRTQGYVTPVKNQGKCGACWAFAAIATMESYNIMKNNSTKILSEQQLVDCAGAKQFKAKGCTGGYPIYAFDYSAQYGLLTSAEYPYAEKDQPCKVDVTNGYKTVSYQRRNIARIPSDLKKVLANGPVAALCNGKTWFNYKSGIFNDCKKDNVQELNHAVLIVGYDAQQNIIIKNSWGTNWGQNGYMTLEAGNTCGILIELLWQTK